MCTCVYFYLAYLLSKGRAIVGRSEHDHASYFVAIFSVVVCAKEVPKDESPCAVHHYVNLIGNIVVLSICCCFFFLLKMIGCSAIYFARQRIIS